MCRSQPSRTIFCAQKRAHRRSRRAGDGHDPGRVARVGRRSRAPCPLPRAAGAVEEAAPRVGGGDRQAGDVLPVVLLSPVRMCVFHACIACYSHLLTSFARHNALVRRRYKTQANDDNYRSLKRLMGDLKEREDNSDVCAVCDEGGNLICCETCPDSVRANV